MIIPTVKYTQKIILARLHVLDQEADCDIDRLRKTLISKYLTESVEQAATECK